MRTGRFHATHRTASPTYIHDNIFIMPNDVTRVEQSLQSADHIQTAKPRIVIACYVGSHKLSFTLRHGTVSLAET
jgi:hypothetical protein